MSKPKVGFNWLASCGGCEEAVVDLEEKIIDVVEAVDIVFWPCAMDFKKDDVRAMEDGEIDVCFVNGAIRTSEEEEVAHLLRKKTKILIAFGSCSHTGGIPGLGNFFQRDDILKNTYEESPSTVNEERTYPQESTQMPEGNVTLPKFLDNVRTLNQVVDVDYYIPGCPPPVKLLLEAVQAVLEGNLPPKGTVLAPDKALCDECPRKETKPEKFEITEFKRPYEIQIDEEKCLLAQGLLCLGPVTRAGCEGACIKANMPCTGCQGPTSRVKDYGAKAMSGLASILTATDEDEIETALNSIVDPNGYFYRYSLPTSLMYKSLSCNGNSGKDGK